MKTTTKIAIIISVIYACFILAGIFGLPSKASESLHQEIGTLIVIEDRIIEITFTDNNSKEDLIIQVDKENYFNLNGFITVYFSVKNNSNTHQAIDLAFSFENENAHIEKLYVSNGTTEYRKVVQYDLVDTTTTTVKQPIEEIQMITKWDRMYLQELDHIKNIPLNVKDTAAHKKLYKGSGITMVGQATIYKAIIDVKEYKGVKKFFIEAFGDNGSYGHLDPWVYEALFNSGTYSTGDLNGQESWSGNAAFDVVSDEYLEGDQSINVQPAGAQIEIEQTGLATGAGDFYAGIYCTSQGTGEPSRYVLYDDGSNRMLIFGIKESSGTVYLYWNYNGAADNLTDISLDTWYIFNVEYDGNHKFRIRWKEQGGEFSSFTDWKDEESASDGTIDEIWLQSSEGGGGTTNVNFDSISPTDPDTSGDESSTSTPITLTTDQMYIFYGILIFLLGFSLFWFKK